MQKKTSRLMCIKDYFGRLPNQGLKSFGMELRALSDAEKTELAQGAARELGYNQSQVNFQL